ncbi:hypothetical protein NUW58_g720 [Xylaria curta]|uniref:Uncharacterized protein n=2 Tax=Xylaria curta TaxID=42375 RepID=A0ACC1PPB6_9PEZI|nr:hypothetical protein NUW58_g892 [Xylaria curta]KAJ2997222.1 hypothetical protein NUW58_g720 [Xylaria curta]
MPHDPTAYWRAPARNYRTLARLHLQHMLFQNTLRFILEKHVEQAIPTAPSSIFKVADLACGNGVWLIGLSRELADKGAVSAKLDGFDINEILFPASAFLPPSVSLENLDVLAKPLPEELIGAYDVVHGLNEPRGLRFEYIAELDQHLIKNGFENVYMSKTAKRKQDYKAWTDDILMAWEECTFLFPSKATDPQASHTRESWAENLAKAVGETEKGVALHAGAITTVVGRKPF